jgi:zinc transporter 1/2/3
MLAALVTLMVDSIMLSFHSRGAKGKGRAAVARHGHDSCPPQVHCHGHGHLEMSEARPEAADKVEEDVEAGKVQLRRNRVIAQVIDPSSCIH